ncbi:amino acid transporter [Conidiobolus coronatus NRRL 28638]|uniref:Amino acid transporter n=1 Tax=Conidiobolus coronatus (strain ATCC 28846 / CBS 209.66 / NRRL 28638) TaxID=796925 RepID=A0A137P3Y3_CONC2|nr:amino acid transporter [Conidiobolus coronatus NRRL 28638]|eukprot:KXN69738.1 amino acid transporter [Conidiobolus coronatus NRRL 28638]
MFSGTNVEYLAATVKSTQLKRNLGLFHLMSLGIGTAIGTGIYVLPGIIAANHAGPGVTLSFVLAGVVAFFSAMSYAELTSMFPVAGSSYTYLYATMGELVAWIIGWTLILEFLVGASAVSVGWSAYLIQLIGIIMGNRDFKTPWADSPVSWDEKNFGFVLSGGYINFPAIAIAVFCTIILVVGTRESTTFTLIFCSLKVLVIIVFIFGSVDHVNPANWSPFIPSDEGFGVAGVFKGASMAFFAFSGFEVIANASQEAKNPQRNMPLSLMLSLGICTALYVVVCLVMTGVVNYQNLGTSYPVSLAIKATGRTWLEVLIILGAVLGMGTSVIGGLLPQSRIFYAMSRDGLLPKIFSKVHPKTRTPYWNQIVLGIVVVIAAGILPIGFLAEIGGLSSLFAFFFINVVVAILRWRKPDLERKFKVPLGGYLFPFCGAATSIALIATSSPSAIVRIFVWMAVGIVIYILYGLQHSKLNNPHRYTEDELNAISQNNFDGH